MASGRAPLRKGKRAEREVARLWRAHGWTRAVPSPGSGSLRPMGARDLSPWPGDIARIEPWLCEVKWDEKVRASSRGWMGEAFIRRTCRRLEELWHRHASIVGAESPNPVLFARASYMDWECWVPDWLFLDHYAPGEDIDYTGWNGAWVNLPVEEFFELALDLAPPNGLHYEVPDQPEKEGEASPRPRDDRDHDVGERRPASHQRGNL